MPKARLYDMDGTLCDVTSIRYLVDPGDPNYLGYRNFNLFHTLSVDCPPHQDVVDAFRQDMRDGIIPIVVTARPERFRTLTRWWLQINHLYPAQQLHRQDYDDRPDTDVKRDILRGLRDHYDVIGAWDDNPRIIALWEAEGIPVDVKPGWPEWGTQQEDAEKVATA